MSTKVDTGSKIGVNIDIIDTPQRLHETLENLGYKSKLMGHYVSCSIGGSNVPFIVTFTSPDHFSKDLEITCIVANIGDIKQEQRGDFAQACLILNAEIEPFAVAILAGEDEVESNDWPIALVDKVPLGDFSINELRSAMENMEKALHGIASIFKHISE